MSAPGENSGRSLKQLLARHPLAISLLVNALVFAFVYTVYEARFQTNDDTHMMLTAAGVSKVTKSSPMLLFSHNWIGAALEALYALSRTTPWYALYLVGALLGAHTALLFTALVRCPSPFVVLFYLLHHLAFGIPVLLELQFTIVASFVAMAGFAMLVYLPLPETAGQSLLRKRSFRLTVLFGLLLVGFACMIRWQSVIMMAALFTPLLVLGVLGRPRRAVVLRVGLFVASLALAFALRQLDVLAYSGNPGWREYQVFNPLLARFTDSRALYHLTPAERKRLCEGVGWSANDANMISDFFFLDEEMYSLAKLQAIVEQLPADRRVGLDGAIHHLRGIGRSTMALSAISLCLLAIASARWRWRDWLAYAVPWLGVPAILIYLTIYFRAPPERVYWPLLFFLFLPPLMSLVSPERKTLARGLGRAALVLLVLTQVPQRLEDHARDSAKKMVRTERVRTALRKISPSPGELYVTWGQSFPWTFIEPFKDLAYLRDFRTFPLGASQRTPDSQRVLKAFDIDDLYLDLATRPDLFFVLYRPSALGRNYQTYMREHYQLDVVIRPVRRFRGFIIARVEARGAAAARGAPSTSGRVQPSGP